MTTSHPDRESLRRFLAAELPGAEDRPVREHLEGGCQACLYAARDEAARAFPSYREFVSRSLGSDASEENRSEAWRLALESGRRIGRFLLELEEALASSLLAEILRRPAAHRREVIRTGRRYQVAGLAHFLAEESRRQCFTDVSQALEIAELSVEVADSLDPATHGRAFVADTRARALAFLGNARRIAFELHEADRTLEAAGHLLLEGSQDPLLRAEYLSLLGSLRTYQNRYREALGPLEGARRIYEEGDLAPECGKTLLQMGCAAGEAGQHELAIGFLRKAFHLVERSGDDRLAHFVRHNLSWYLVDAGEPSEALAWFEKNQPYYEPFASEPGARIRRRWLEGRIHAALDDRDTALEALEEACSFAAERDLVYEAAQIMLDLAVLHLEAGRPAEVRKVTARLSPIFRSRQLHGFALGALMLFRQAVETEDASAHLARRLARYLHQAQTNPYLTFDP